MTVSINSNPFPTKHCARTHGQKPEPNRWKLPKGNRFPRNVLCSSGEIRNSKFRSISFSNHFANSLVNQSRTVCLLVESLQQFIHRFWDETAFVKDRILQEYRPHTTCKISSDCKVNSRKYRNSSNMFETYLPAQRSRLLWKGGFCSKNENLKKTPHPEQCTTFTVWLNSLYCCG